MIAVNLNADLFGRGTTIADHGSDPDDEVWHEIKPDRRGLRGLFAAEQLVKRQFLGESGRPGMSTVMVEAFNIMQDRRPGPGVFRRRHNGRDHHRAIAFPPAIRHRAQFKFHLQGPGRGREAGP